MSASRRNPETLVNFCREPVAVPKAESRRALPEINQNIEDSTRSHPDELPLCCGSSLVVEASEDMTRGAAMVVLHKVGIDAKVPEGVPIPRLEEEASGVAEDLGLEEEGVMDFSGEFGHRREAISSLDCRLIGQKIDRG